MEPFENLTPIRSNRQQKHNSTSLMLSPSAGLIKQRQKRYSTPLKTTKRVSPNTLLMLGSESDEYETCDEKENEPVAQIDHVHVKAASRLSTLIESLSCSKGEFEEHETRIRELEKENADLKEALMRNNEPSFRDENTELKEELALEKSISDDFDRQVKKQRGQIEKLLDVIDQKEQMIQALKAENCELKDGVNSIYSYLSTEQQKLMTTVREKIENYQNES